MNRPKAGGLPRGGILIAVACCALLYLGYCCAFFLHDWGRAASLFDAVMPGGSELSDEEKKAHIRAELGRGTWNMLHRFAARFDAEPSLQRQKEARDFINLMGTFYPCPDCAAHFRQILEQTPPDVSSNRALSVWFCARHNEVNRRLDKPEFPCTLESLAQRYGECGCFGNVTEPAAGGGGAADAGSRRRVLGRGQRAGNVRSTAGLSVREAWES